VGSIRDFFLLLLQQFAGGPGPAENNLMRFGLAAIMWLVLFVIAWSRQRSQNLPRERLLVWGFGLAFVRELFMFSLIAGRVSGLHNPEVESVFYHPLEHGLAMTAIIVVAGAFLRYILNDELLSKRYLQIGIGMTFLALLIAFITWPRYAAANPETNFHQTWEAWIFHVPVCIMIAAAIFLLARKRGWVRNAVIVALSFFFISEFFILVNFATDTAYSNILCPIGNSLHILAIPIFGYVYLREQSIEKQKAEEELADYRDHLEELVEERTTRLAAQNEIADTLSQSLDLETLLNMALEKVRSLLEMDVGLIFLINPETNETSLHSYQGNLSKQDLASCMEERCSYKEISDQAIYSKQATIWPLSDAKHKPLSKHIRQEGIQTLVSAPLVSKDRVVGAITLGTKKTQSLDEADKELLTSIGQQIGMAIENAHLYYEAEQYAEELSTLHQASIIFNSTLDSDQINFEIAQQSAKLLNCELACILNWDQDLQLIKILACYGMQQEEEESLIENPDARKLFTELHQKRNSIAINNTMVDTRIPKSWKKNLKLKTLLCTPVWGPTEPIEFLFLMDRRETRLWSAEDIEFVESFVNRAALALENAKLHKQLEWAAALEERQRIAANMHDGLAQTLSLLGLRVDNLAERVSNDKEINLEGAIEQIRDTVSQASIEVRRSISSLQESPKPRRPLQVLLCDLVEQFSTHSKPEVHCSFNIDEPIFIPPDQKAQVSPIIQEVLINALRHSNAQNIDISVVKDDTLISISIQDDGIGFDPDTIQEDGRGHFGLRIMRARATRLGGRLELNTSPNKGTCVRLSWDMETNQQNGNKFQIPEVQVMQIHEAQ